MCSGVAELTTTVPELRMLACLFPDSGLQFVCQVVPPELRASEANILISAFTRRFKACDKSSID